MFCKHKIKYVPGRKDAEEPLWLLAFCKDPKNIVTDNFKRRTEKRNKVQI